MKKKLLFIIILLLCLTGCNVEYNLTFNGNIVSEEIISTISTSEIPKLTEEEKNAGISLNDRITPFIENDQYVFEDDNTVIYDKNVETRGNKKIVTLKHDYTMAEFLNSKVYNTCFDQSYIGNYEEGFLIIFKGEFYCSGGGQVKVNVKTDKYVADNNADIVSEDGIYTWVINEENMDNTELYLYVLNEEAQSSDSNGIVLAILIIILLAIIGFGVYYFFFRNKKKPVKKVTSFSDFKF